MHIRRLVCATIFLFTTGACIAQPGHVASNAPACRASDVSINDSNVGDAAMSKTLTVYTVQYHGPSACQLTGYPTIAVYDAGGKPLPRFVTYSPSTYFTNQSNGPTPVILASGQSAWFAIENASACDATVGSHLTVQLGLPGSGSPLRTVVFPNANCPVTVTPIRPMWTLKVF